MTTKPRLQPACLSLQPPFNRAGESASASADGTIRKDESESAERHFTYTNQTADPFGRSVTRQIRLLIRPKVRYVHHLTLNTLRSSNEATSCHSEQYLWEMHQQTHQDNFYRISSPVARTGYQILLFYSSTNTSRETFNGKYQPYECMKFWSPSDSYAQKINRFS